MSLARDDETQLMILHKLIADVEARAGVTRAFQLILSISLLTNVLMAGVLFTMDRTVRTILVPPETSKTFWVDGRRVGPEYLEQMGTWVVSQYATVSPSSIDYQNALLLKYVHPSVHGDLSIRFKMGASRIKSENISKIFMPREVRISESAHAVVLIGTQVTFIADKRVPNDEIKAYLVAFDYDGSRVVIKELRETSLQKPFDPPNQQIAQESELSNRPVPDQQMAPRVDFQEQNTKPYPTPASGLPPEQQADVSPIKESVPPGSVQANPATR